MSRSNRHLALTFSADPAASRMPRIASTMQRACKQILRFSFQLFRVARLRSLLYDDQANKIPVPYRPHLGIARNLADLVALLSNDGTDVLGVYDHTKGHFIL